MTRLARLIGLDTVGSLVAGFLLAPVCGLAHAEDWPHWNGVNRNGTSSEKGLLQKWPEGGPALAWRVDSLGGGDSAPSIAQGKIYGMSSREGKDLVWALSEKDGKVLWTTPVGETHVQRVPQSKEGPGCTPTVDGDRLYVLGMGGNLTCLDHATGKVVWQKNLIKDFAGQMPMWSYRESPLVDGDKVICTPGGTKATIVALNKLTGETVWESKLEEAAAPTPAPMPPPGRGGFGRFGPGSAAGYSSAIPVDFDGERQYVQLTAKALVGVSAKDGRVLWRYNAPANRMGISCSSPIFQDGMVFAASAYGAGGGLAKLTKGGDGKINAQEMYFTNKMQNHHGGMVVTDGCLYGANGGNEGGALICLDFQTGKVLWDKRGDKKVAKGSIALADGRIYYRQESGTVVLVEPNKEKYIEQGRFEQPDRSNTPAWAHPVIANGKLYIRDQGLLFCYDIRSK
jgi:outer membrane protein assembly factor BamB